MKYLVCEVEYRSDFSDDSSERKPIRVIQMVDTIEDAKILIDYTNNIEGYREDTGGRNFDILEIN